jgi:hypothetical protein
MSAATDGAVRRGGSDDSTRTDSKTVVPRRRASARYARPAGDARKSWPTLVTSEALSAFSSPFPRRKPVQPLPNTPGSPARWSGAVESVAVSCTDAPVASVSVPTSLVGPAPAAWSVSVIGGTGGGAGAHASTRSW